MKYVKRLLLMVAVAMSSVLPTMAQKFESGGIYYQTTSTSSNNLTVQVTCRGSYYDSYDNEYVGDIVIPPTVVYNNKTYKVTAIQGRAFYECIGMTSISLPEGMKTFHDRAFEGCTGLTVITLPSTMTSVAGNSFERCENLRTIRLKSEIIGEYWFDDLNHAVDVILENSVTTIGDNAFCWCSGLISVSIPESVTSIGKNAFSGCSSLTSVTFPENLKLTSIGYNAFSGCSSLTSVTLPESVTSVGNYAFDGCTGELIVNCDLSSSSIKSGAFNGNCFAKVTIGEGVTSIGDDMFEDSRNLISLSVSENVVEIGDDAFAGCEMLQEITCYAVTPPRCSGSFDGVNKSECVLYVPGSSYRKYQKASDWSSFDIKAIPGTEGDIEPEPEPDPEPDEPDPDEPDPDSKEFQLSADGVLTIAMTGALEGSISTLVNSDIPIREVILKEGVTEIGNNVFFMCNSITSVSIPRSVKKIGDAAFFQCTSLSSVDFLGEIDEIGKQAFSGCSSLSSISFTERVGVIGQMAFVSSGLKNLDIAAGVNKICQSAFSQCENLSEMNLAGSVGEIEYCAFFQCLGLTKLEILGDIEKIGQGAFMNCSNLSTASFYGKIGEVGTQAFVNCTSLASISFSEVERMGQMLFYGCNKLSSIRCMAVNPPVCEYGSSFLTIDTSIPVYVPAVSVSLYKNAEGWKDFANIIGEGVVEVISIALNRTTATLEKGDILQLIATVNPSDATDKTVTWSSSNTEVAVVENHGKVIAKGVGSAIITAKVGDKEATCRVEVIEFSDVNQVAIGETEQVIYDLCGNRILNSENLKGIYIVNGKKIVIK